MLIVFDNVKIFKVFEKLLRWFYDNWEVKEYLESNWIDWRFNLERVFWWGGFYECLIGIVKCCFRKVFGNVRFSVDELLIVLMELEVIFNLWFLMYDYDEFGVEMFILLYFIYGCWLLSLLEMRNDEEESEMGLLRRFRYFVKLRIYFWNWWWREYLIDLREYYWGKKES